MLKLRILSALVAISLVVYIIFDSTDVQFKVITLFVVGLAAWEWGKLAGFNSIAAKLLYSLVVTACAYGSHLLPTNYVIEISMAAWLLYAVFVFAYPKLTDIWSIGPYFRMVAGIVTLSSFWLSLHVSAIMHMRSALLVLLVLVWGVDSGAYFSGRQWGKKKLLPNVSPGKTRAGFWGGMLTVIPVMAISGVLMEWPLEDFLPMFLLGFVVALFAVFGDLFESMLKRQAGVKDSGNIMPGHGGLLDRIDALIAAAPVYALGVKYILMVS